jgi:hypothetical protein
MASQGKDFATPCLNHQSIYFPVPPVYAVYLLAALRIVEDDGFLLEWEKELDIWKED